jgi:hypothetical protein
VNYFSNLLQTVRHISVHVTIADQWEARRRVLLASDLGTAD